MPKYNREEFKQFATALPQSLSDINWSWDKVIIEGNSAAQQFTIKAKHTGKGPAIPVEPTGKEVIIKGCAIYKLENDKVIEFTEFSDFLGLFQQLGIVPPSGP